MPMDRGDTLLMTGDSITDCGRARPVGLAAGGGLGNGYPALVQQHLTALRPADGLRVVNTGTSGNTVRDLAARWREDVLAYAPQWLSVCIGINDVWRHFDSWLEPRAHVPLDEYRHTLDGLLAEVRPKVKGLLLLTPFYVEPNRADPLRAMMDRYGAAVAELAQRHEAILVDTQALFDAHCVHRHATAIAADRVHPDGTGHLLLARAVLKALGQGLEA